MGRAGSALQMVQSPGAPEAGGIASGQGLAVPLRKHFALAVPIYDCSRIYECIMFQSQTNLNVAKTLTFAKICTLWIVI